MAVFCPMFQTTPIQYNDREGDNNADAVQDCISPLYDTKKKKKLFSQSAERWKDAALFFSFISIMITLSLVIANFIIAGVSDSTAAFGAGIDTLLNIISSLVIVWRYSESIQQPDMISERDRKATICVILLFLLGSLTIFIVATKNLLKESSIQYEDSVVIVFTVAAVCYIFLYFVKSVISERLDSKALAVDAIDSLAAGFISVAVICGAMIIKYFPKAWFVDESLALCIALIMAIYGARLLYETFVPRGYTVELLSDPDRLQ